MLPNRIEWLYNQYKTLMSDQAYARDHAMPSGNYALEDDSILSLPRDDGDSRYPYGEGGFNFWTYGSGYMHCNEGLFSPFLRASEGAEPKIAFFLTFGEEGAKEVVPILSVPMMAPSKNEAAIHRFTVFSMSETYYMCEVHGVLAAIRVFVDEANTITFTSHLTNLNKDLAKACQFSYYLNPFVKNALVENSVDRWFRNVEVAYKNRLPYFVVEAYEEVDRSKMAPNIGVYKVVYDLEDPQFVLEETTTSRYEYVGGSRSSLATPKSLFEGSFRKGQAKTAFTETAIMGGLITLNLKDTYRVDGRFSYCFDEDTKEDQVTEAFSKEGVDERALEVSVHEQKKQADLKMHVSMEKEGPPAKVLDTFMKHVMKQVEFCSVIKGYIQLSSFSLIGIRDVFQALEGVQYYQPEIARAKMIEALGFITKEGRCPRQYILPRERGQVHSMDLRPFIDQGVWVISAIISYLKYTKDYDFLKVPCGYYEFLDEEKHLAKQAEGESTVLKHMFDIMDYLLAQQDTGHTDCIHALYGDWNDALDGLGKTSDPNRPYGTGVSVMASLQVYQNLNEMIELIEVLKEENIYKDEGHVKVYEEARGRLERGLNKYALSKKKDEIRLVHGWGDHRKYLVGSHCDPDGQARDGLTSNAFWVLSGLYDGDATMKETILGAFSRLEGKYGLKTFHPAFVKDTNGVGRIPNLPEGTAENGATYIHASLFGVMALFKMGESKKAWEELIRLLPITHDAVSCSPFVMPNSYGYNEALNIDGESMSDWQTGSSNVLLKVLIKEVYGFEPTFHGVMLKPARYNPYGEMAFKIRYLDTNVHINYSKSSGGRTYLVDGKRFAGSYDPVLGFETLFISDRYFTGKDVHIEVTL